MNRRQLLIVLCGIVVVGGILVLPRKANDPNAMEILVAEAKLSLSPEAHEQIDSLERGYKRDKGIALLESLSRSWEAAGNIPVAASYALQASEEQPSAETLKRAGFLLSEAFRDTTTTDESLQFYFLQMSMRSLENCRALDSVDNEVNVELATLLIDGTGEVMQGVQLLREVTERDSLHLQANLMLGQLSLRSGQFERAVTRFRQAVSADTNNTDALIGLGNAHMALDQTDNAIQYFEKASGLLEDSPLKEAVDKMIEETKN